MRHIVIDATSVVYGQRAVKRNSYNLINALLSTENNDICYTLFYFDWRGNGTERISLPAHGRHQEYICRIPWRLLRSFWRVSPWPTIETMLGKVDLLYAPDLYFPPTRKAIAMTTLRGIAYVTVPELCEESQNKGLMSALGYAMKYADYFLAVSEHTQKEVEKFLHIPKERLRVSPHGVAPDMHFIADRQHVKAELFSRYQINYPYLLYVGAITHRKNILPLLHAFEKSQRDFGDMHLVLAGAPDNAYDDAIRFIHNKALAEKIHFVGPFPPESDDLLYLYNGAAMLIYPTLHEGWTAPPLEAMACGIPVVTSDYSSVPETCGGAAYLVDPLSVESIASGIRKLLIDDSYRKTLVKIGFQRVQKCSWENSATRLEKIFLQLIEQYSKEL